MQCHANGLQSSVCRPSNLLPRAPDAAFANIGNVLESADADVDVAIGAADAAVDDLDIHVSVAAADAHPRAAEAVEVWVAPGRVPVEEGLREGADQVVVAVGPAACAEGRVEVGDVPRVEGGGSRGQGECVARRQGAAEGGRGESREGHD